MIADGTASAFFEIVWPKLRIASCGVGLKKMTRHYAYIAAQPSVARMHSVC